MHIASTFEILSTYKQSRADKTRDNMVRWDIAFAVLGHCAVCTGLVHCGVNDLPGNVFHDKRNGGRWTFSTVRPAGIQQCVRMCLLDGHCRSLTFERNQLACHLNNQTVDPSSLITEYGYVFINNIQRTHGQVIIFYL